MRDRHPAIDAAYSGRACHPSRAGGRRQARLRHHEGRAHSQGGGVQMGPGTLYGTLDRLIRDGLVEESGISDDERRRYYRLTARAAPPSPWNWSGWMRPSPRRALWGCCPPGGGHEHDFRQPSRCPNGPDLRARLATLSQALPRGVCRAHAAGSARRACGPHGSAPLSAGHRHPRPLTSIVKEHVAMLRSTYGRASPAVQCCDPGRHSHRCRLGAVCHSATGSADGRRRSPNPDGHGPGGPA